MIFFGWGGGKAKDVGPAAPITCPNCRNATTFHYVTSTKWFRLYFVPIIPYSRKHFLLCPVCTRGMALTSETARLAAGMVPITRARIADELTEPEYQQHLEGFFEAIGILPAGVARAVDAPPAEPPQLRSGLDSES